MLHMSRTPFKLSTRLEMLATGCYVSYDMFGFETYYTRKYGVFDLLNDNQCINEIMELINEGYLERILISQDTAFKHCLACYGGRGYAHLIENVIPLMQPWAIISRHGTLHLLGYDHQTSEQEPQVRAREQEILSLLEGKGLLSDPL